MGSLRLPRSPRFFRWPHLAVLWPGVLFADSTNAQTPRADPGGKQFFYVKDEQGRRFPIMRSSSAAVDISVKPEESVKFFLTFVAPTKAGSLYLTGDVGAPAWVRLYFGSDLNPSTGARSCV